MTQNDVVSGLKKIMSDRLRLPPERVQPLTLHDPLLKDGLGLDSLDCIELLLGIEDTFDLAFDETEDEWIHHFHSLATLSQLVLRVKGEAA